MIFLQPFLNQYSVQSAAQRDAQSNRNPVNQEIMPTKTTKETRDQSFWINDNKMVFFCCDGCGETLKKNKVDAHAARCRQCASVSCVDCGVSFFGGEF